MASTPMLSVLNERWRAGQPSDDLSGAGLPVHVLDGAGVTTPLNCLHGLAARTVGRAAKLFGATASCQTVSKAVDDWARDQTGVRAAARDSWRSFGEPDRNVSTGDRISISVVSRQSPHYFSFFFVPEYIDAGLKRMPFVVLDADAVGGHLSCCYPVDEMTTQHKCATWGGDAECIPGCRSLTAYQPNQLRQCLSSKPLLSLAGACKAPASLKNAALKLGGVEEPDDDVFCCQAAAPRTSVGNRSTPDLSCFSVGGTDNEIILDLASGGIKHASQAVGIDAAASPTAVDFARAVHAQAVLDGARIPLVVYNRSALSEAFSLMASWESALPPAPLPPSTSPSTPPPSRPLPPPPSPNPPPPPDLLPALPLAADDSDRWEVVMTAAGSVSLYLGLTGCALWRRLRPRSHGGGGHERVSDEEKL